VRCKPLVPPSMRELQITARVDLHLASFLGEIVSVLPSKVSLHGRHMTSSSPAVGTRTISEPMTNRRSAAIKRNEGAAGFGEVESVHSLQGISKRNTRYPAGRTPNTLRPQGSSSSMTLWFLAPRIGQPQWFPHPPLPDMSQIPSHRPTQC
jgi:hypothetical protein